MKASNKKYLGVLISAAGMFGLTACNSGASNQAGSTTTTEVSAQTTPTTPSCLIINLNSTTPNSKTKNNLLLTIQNNCSETLQLNTKSLAFMSQDVARTPINAPTTFSATADNGKKYSLSFGAVDPQTGLVQSVATKKFTLAPQEGIMMKGNGTLNGVAYDSKTANATLQIIDKANPLADKCIKAHMMVENPDAKKANTAIFYVENSCDVPQPLKGKEISFLSQDLAGYPVGITQIQGVAANNTNYSVPFNSADYYLYGKLAPDNLVLDPHQGVQLSSPITLHGSKYDFFTAERTLLVQNIPATPSACLSGHVFVDPDATTMNTEIQVAVQNNCDSTQPVYGKDISFVAQDINNSPIWVSTLMVNTKGFAEASGIYTMNFDTQPDAQNRMHRFITPVKNTPELLLPAHQTLTFTGTAPLMGYAFDLQTAEQSFSVTN